MIVIYFCKQKTAFDMRISDWSSDVCSSDLLIAIGARCDDRVIGNPRHFAQVPRKIVHIDIDPSSLSKRVRVDVPIVGDVKDVLQDLIGLYAQAIAEQAPDPKPLATWREQINTWLGKTSLDYEPPDTFLRSEERSVGTQCISTCK